ncbi:MAG: hypothetical protein COB85_07255 [Bacteroidetes bacterium]|nr:MAG: hypothetical protein COB85_07255 [Bacteroidota bacterium]
MILEGMGHVPSNAELEYRITAYYLENKERNKAYNHLVNGLELDYEKHSILLTFYPRANELESITDLIALYREDS